MQLVRGMRQSFGLSFPALRNYRDCFVKRSFTAYMEQSKTYSNSAVYEEYDTRSAVKSRPSSTFFSPHSESRTKVFSLFFFFHFSPLHVPTTISNYIHTAQALNNHTSWTKYYSSYDETRASRHVPTSMFVMFSPSFLTINMISWVAYPLLPSPNHSFPVFSQKECVDRMWCFFFFFEDVRAICYIGSMNPTIHFFLYRTKITWWYSFWRKDWIFF